MKLPLLSKWDGRVAGKNHSSDKLCHIEIFPGWERHCDPYAGSLDHTTTETPSYSWAKDVNKWAIKSDRRSFCHISTIQPFDLCCLWKFSFLVLPFKLEMEWKIIVVSSQSIKTYHKDIKSFLFSSVINWGWFHNPEIPLI